MRLEAVYIEGFRSLEVRQEIPIGAPTILAGHNDAGKSAVLDAVAFLLDGYKITERDRTYGAVGPSGIQTRVPETLVEGLFWLSAEEQETLGLSSRTRLRRRSDETGETLEVLREVPTDERLRDIENQKVDTLKHRLEGFGLPSSGLKQDLVARLEAIAASADTTEVWTAASPELRRSLPRPQRFDATSTQDPEQAILGALRSSYRSHLDDEELKGDVRQLTTKLEARVTLDAEALRRHIKAKCDDIGDVQISPSISWDGGLKSTEISAKNDRGEAIHLGQSGTGRSRRIALAVWEHNAQILGSSGEDTVLLYDEPDTHLDYRHQRGFMKLLEDQAELPNVQIIVASHSMNLIDGVDISNVLHLHHADSRTVIEKISDDSETGKHLGAIATSLGLRNTVLLHERLFVGVEGDTESRAFPVLFKLATGRQLESCGIAIWPCNNNDGALRFAQYLAAHDRQVLMVIDEDSRDLKLFSEQSLGRHGLTTNEHMLTVGVREFEDTFTDDQWTTCARKNWPRTDGRDWAASDFRAHRDAKFSSQVEKMIRDHSSVSISGKPDIMVTLALGLESKEDIPQDLRTLFDELINRAN